MSRFLDPQTVEVSMEVPDQIYSADLTIDRTILAVGELAQVEGITIANSSGSPAEVTFVDGAANLLFRETIGQRSSQNLPIRFRTSGGLVAENLTGGQADDVFINVFYLHPVA